MSDLLIVPVLGRGQLLCCLSRSEVPPISDVTCAHGACWGSSNSGPSRWALAAVPEKPLCTAGCWARGPPCQWWPCCSRYGELQGVAGSCDHACQLCGGSCLLGLTCYLHLSYSEALQGEALTKLPSDLLPASLLLGCSAPFVSS